MRPDERVSIGRPWWAGALLCALAGMALPASVRAAGESCDAAICQGNPCTIQTRHKLTQNCTLDWSGRDVILASGGRLQGKINDSTLTIRARSLRIEGLLETRGGVVSIETSGDLSITGSEPGGWLRLRGRRRDLASVLTLRAGGDLTVAGRGVAAYSGGLASAIEGRSVTILAELGVDAHSWTNQLTLRATAGDLVSSGNVHARVRGVDGIGDALVSATGRIQLDGPLNGAGGSRPMLRVQAGTDLVAAGAISADGVRDEESWGGDLYLTAGGDVVLTGAVSARSPGVLGKGGTIVVQAGPGHDVTIEGPVDASSNDSSHGRDGAILVGPACDVRVGGALRVGGAVGDGEISIAYRRSLDLAGASLLALASPNQILCPCVDPNGDGVCNAPCNPAPVGDGTAAIDPAVVFRKVSAGACPG